MTASLAYNNHILQWHKGTLHAIPTQLVKPLTTSEKGKNQKVQFHVRLWTLNARKIIFVVHYEAFDRLPAN